MDMIGPRTSMWAGGLISEGSYPPAPPSAVGMLTAPTCLCRHTFLLYPIEQGWPDSSACGGAREASLLSVQLPLVGATILRAPPPSPSPSLTVCRPWRRARCGGLPPLALRVPPAAGSLCLPRARPLAVRLARRHRRLRTRGQPIGGRLPHPLCRRRALGVHGGSHATASADRQRANAAANWRAATEEGTSDAWRRHDAHCCGGSGRCGGAAAHSDTRRFSEPRPRRDAAAVAMGRCRPPPAPSRANERPPRCSTEASTTPCDCPSAPSPPGRANGHPADAGSDVADSARTGGTAPPPPAIPPPPPPAERHRPPGRLQLPHR